MIPSYMNPYSNSVSTYGILPMLQSPESLHLTANQADEPHGWFYCLPHHRQAISPGSKSVIKDEVPSSLNKADTDQRRFLVFDQSGDQTTFMFSPAIRTSMEGLSSFGPSPYNGHNFSGERPGTERDSLHNAGPILTDGNEINGTDLESEMHEDTEELNALLYSDDENDYSEDDEETSTGHSPSTMTSNERLKSFEGSAEEVASTAEPSKKRKLSLMDTATSRKSIQFLGYEEDDAESSCGNDLSQGNGGEGSKRLRRERIRATVSILQSIIPNGMGKDAVAVLDEAINYFRSLKLKAKALGLDSL